MSERTAEDALRDLARFIDTGINRGGVKKLGFAFFLAMDHVPDVFYASNAERADVKRLLAEWSETVTRASLLRGATRETARSVFLAPHPVLAVTATIGEALERHGEDLAFALFVFEWHKGGQIAWHFTKRSADAMKAGIDRWRQGAPE